MNRSRGRGGPLDGILIEAPSRWDGRVRTQPNGHYVWNTDVLRWVWKPEEPVTSGEKRRRR